MDDVLPSLSADKPAEIGSWWRSPVFLTAVFGAIIAAFANAYVAWINNNTLVDIETHKESEEQLIENRKAEFTRLLEISKLDVDQAKKKIKAFCEMLLITDSAICLSSASSTKSNTGSQTAAPSKPPEELPPITYDSGWVGGGHNQQEICSNAIPQLANSDGHKGKIISFQSASEDSRKDFLGHVAYRYHCIYNVSNP